MPKTSPAARASRAAAATTQTRAHLRMHQEHRHLHDAIALSGGAVLGDESQPGLTQLMRKTVEDHGARIPMTPKEEAAVESLIADHPAIAPSLTRRDPGESGPVLAHFGDETYVIDGDKVAKAAG